MLLTSEPDAAVGEISRRSWLIASTVAMLIVALAGWIDDRGGLSARIRFGAHCLAGLVLLGPLLPVIIESWQLDSGPPPPGLLVIVAAALLLVVLSLVWSINLHNFMDGINGLLASQAIFVLATSGLVNWFHGGIEAGSLALIAAAAVAGFLPFNFPRARIFMGDVGSGALGLLVAIAVLSMARDKTLDTVIAGLIACSAFVIDATATLLSRMLRGRRWYSAHREHLYQWLVRSGFRHGSVVGLYMAWNIVVVVPAMLLIPSGRTSMSTSSAGPIVSPLGIAVLLAVYAFGIAMWLVGKRWSLVRVRAGSSHGIA